MGNRLGNSKELYVILSNYIIGGKQVDMTVMKKNAILVIELKNCIESFTANENGSWQKENGGMVGHEGYNPFRQIMEYREEWVDLLKENKGHFDCFKNIRNNQPFWYTKGYVAIHPFLNKNCTNKISSRKNWWFRLCGIDELDERIQRETNRIINFSDNDLRFIAENLLSMDKPKIIQSENTGNFVEQIRKSTESLLLLIEGCEKETMKSSRENQSLKMNAKTKEDKIIRMKEEIDRLKDILQRRDDIIQKMEKEDAEKFILITHHIIYEYKDTLSKEKAKNLIKLSGQFGITKSQAVKIFNEIYKARKKI